MTDTLIPVPLRDAVAAIRPVDERARRAAEDRQSRLTKPPGALGRLEEIGNQLAAVAGACPPPPPVPALVGVFAGDHGVTAQGVSAWPPEVSAQMAAGIVAGGAGVCVLARDAGVDVRVIDVGLARPVPGTVDRRVRAGTADLSQGPALTRDEALQAIGAGITEAHRAADEGYRCLLTGEVGIGNTTPAAALVAAFTGSDAAATTGRGAGASDALLAHKVGVVAAALARHRPDPADPVGVLAAVGGLEHAALTGFLLGAAARRLPVVLDGVIACSAALAAVALAPAARGYLVAGHDGVEAGVGVALAHLGLRPLLGLDLRLGEGSGAVAAYPLVRASARVLAEMATFAEAGVTGDGA